MDCRRRLLRLRAELARRKLDLFLTTHPADLRYFAGFPCTTGLLAVGPRRAALFLDGRYREKGEALAPHLAIRPLPAAETELRAVGGSGARRGFAGYDEDQVSCGQLKRWSRLYANVFHFVPAPGLAAGLRSVKDPGEIARLREAGKLLAQIWNGSRPEIRPGISELEIVALFGSAIFRATGAAPPFETIVASGPHAARPHHSSSDRVLKRGELVLIDVGLCLAGYTVDLTRTLGFPPVPKRMLKTWSLVLAAQRATARAARPGVTGADLDAAARRVFRRAGVEKHFTHSLGHGVGLEVHEEPRLQRRAVTPLRPGMVFTIEPGLYHPNDHGVRIEDTFLLTPRGLECLTPVPLEPPDRRR